MNKKLLQERFVGRKKRRLNAIENDETKMRVKQEKRAHALAEIRSTLDVEKIQEITRNMECDEVLLEMDELDQLETKIFGLIVA